MKLDVRMSPRTVNKGTTKTVRKRAKNTTGGVALGPDGPQSTYVSSPIQQAAQRRQNRRRLDNKVVVHHSGYADDGFVGSDDQRSTTESSDTDYFEPVRDSRNTQSRGRPPLGPPITVDESMRQLDDIHRMVVEDFVRVAKVEGEKVYPTRVLKIGSRLTSMIDSKHQKSSSAAIHRYALSADGHSFPKEYVIFFQFFLSS